MRIKIGAVVGSARKNSFSKKAANAFISYLPNECEVHFIDIDQLELFNQDYDDEGATPKSWDLFRAEVDQMDAFIFVTPEYNRSVPPILKNALDIASRPYGQNRWSGKPGSIISISPGALGGFGANHHLRQTLAFLNVYTMPQPEIYLSNITDALDAHGNFSNKKTLAFLKSAADAYIDWVSNFITE